MIILCLMDLLTSGSKQVRRGNAAFRPNGAVVQRRCLSRMTDSVIPDEMEQLCSINHFADACVGE